MGAQWFLVARNGDGAGADRGSEHLECVDWYLDSQMFLVSVKALAWESAGEWDTDSVG